MDQSSNQPLDQSLDQPTNQIEVQSPVQSPIAREKEYAIFIYDDYRTGTNVDLVSVGEEEYPEEYSEFKVSLPLAGKYRLYVIQDSDEPGSIFHIDFKEEENRKVIYEKIYSQINGCLPFVVTGLTPGYREKGEYPEISEFIESIPNILPQELCSRIINDTDRRYAVIAADSDGDLILIKDL